MAEILVVDDSMLIRNILKNLVELKNHVAHEASGYEQALAQVNYYRPGLVFLDIIMDNRQLSGLKLLSYIKKQFPHIVVVMVTSIGSQEEIIKQCVQEGADEYISKPFKEDQILKVMDTFLA